MTLYEFQFDYAKHTLSFWTDNETMYADVTKYIQNCIDACSWRNRVQEVKRIDESEDE